VLFGIRYPRPCANEYYIVGADVQCLPDYANKLGKPPKPGFLYYSLDEIYGGKFVIRYEVLRYIQSHRLPPIDGDDLVTTALFGVERHLDYFGNFQAPLHTPRGLATRRRKLVHGVFAAET